MTDHIRLAIRATTHQNKVKSERLRFQQTWRELLLGLRSHVYGWHMIVRSVWTCTQYSKEHLLSPLWALVTGVTGIREISNKTWSCKRRWEYEQRKVSNTTKIRRRHYEDKATRSISSIKTINKPCKGEYKEGRLLNAAGRLSHEKGGSDCESWSSGNRATGSSYSLIDTLVTTGSRSIR